MYKALTIDSFPIVCVCGSRNWTNAESLWWNLDRLRLSYGVSEIWHGAAAGADLIASEWARYRLLPIREFPADWTLGRSAGPRRNAEMIAALPADSVVACFTAGPLAESIGSADCVRRSLARGLRVWLAEGTFPARWIVPAPMLAR